MSTAAMMEHLSFSIENDKEQIHTDFGLEEPKNSAPPVWRSLLQLKVLLPYLARIVPLLEGNTTSVRSPATARNEPIRQDILDMTRSLETVSKGFLDMQAGQRELRTNVQEQTFQLQRIDHELLRLCEWTERNALEHQELVEDLNSASKLVRTLSSVMIVMMTGVVAMVAFLLVHAIQ